jgi:hypothetical protein
MAEVTGYEIFRDLLMIFLTVAAITGTIIYLILSEAITRKASLAAKRELYKALVRYHISCGYDYWRVYDHMEHLFGMEGVSEKDLNKRIFPKEFKNMLETEVIPLTVPITKEKKAIFVVREEEGKPHVYLRDIWKLDQAIETTALGYNRYISELDAREEDSEFLICWIMNNLAYYYAERQKFGAASSGDDAIARKFAKYVHDRIYKYPEEKENWSHTYHFVQKQFPQKR